MGWIMKTNKGGLTTLVSVEEDERLNEIHDQEITESDVTELSEPEDMIGIENSVGEKIGFGSQFSNGDGDLGDESEDMSDYPGELKHNHYDPTLSVGGSEEEVTGNPDTFGMHITDAEHAGIAYDENDYTKD